MTCTLNPAARVIPTVYVSVESVVFSWKARETGCWELNMPRVPVAETFTVARWFPGRFLKRTLMFATSAFKVRFSVFMSGADAVFDWLNDTGFKGARTTTKTMTESTSNEIRMIAHTGSIGLLVWGVVCLEGAAAEGATAGDIGVPQTRQNFALGSNWAPHLRQ